MGLRISDSRIRRNIVKKYLSNSCKPKEIIAENAIILDRVFIEEGAIICSHTHLTSDITIGKYFHCNIYSYVGHDCVIGDYVTFAPKVCCNGNILIEDNVFIGTGAIIKQGKPGNPIVIGKGAVIGMGAVVTKDVPAHSVVIGNPARVV
jgi:sugar O-acyltransferase (sialic acid O-acetyltransferase NeuD family)